MLESVSIENFRCLRQARIEFDPRATLIWGDNGSGKTSALEALSFVSSGRSFRTNLREHLVTRGAEVMRVVARCRHELGETSLGAEWTSAGTRLRLGGRSVRSAVEMATVLPLQVIDPGVHRLIEEGSARRRRLLDWGVFHVKQEFMPAWRRYQRALEQRNAVLRSGGAPSDAKVWDVELATAGSTVDAARREYMSEWLPHFEALRVRLLSQPASLSFHSGWSTESTLADALDLSLARDLRVRFTSVGPHRADLRFQYDGQSARDRVSRGEQKMLAITMILAQIRCLAASANRQSCLLVDDPAAELDAGNLGKLLDVLDALPAQLVITAVKQEALDALSFGRTFHVKHGEFVASGARPDFVR